MVVCIPLFIAMKKEDSIVTESPLHFLSLPGGAQLWPRNGPQNVTDRSKVIPPIRPEGGPKLCPKSASGGGGLLYSRRFCLPARTIRILQLHGHLKVQGAELAKKVHVWKLVFIMKQLMVRIVFSYQIYQFWKLYGTDGIGKDARDHTYPSGTTPRCHV